MTSRRLIIGDDDTVARWVSEQADVLWLSGAGKAIGWAEGGELLAGVVYQNYNGVNVFTHIAGKGMCWLSRKFLWTIFDYPFNQLGCRRITATVLASNTTSRRFVEHLGFSLESTMRQAARDGDVLVYVMFREDCRWLHLPSKYKEL